MNTVEKTILFSFLLRGVCCRDFSISLTEKIEALSGSCVIIKCTFEIEDEYNKGLSESNATGLWLKDKNDLKTQVFNSRDPKPNHFKGKITGKLHEKNCTTIFYNVSSNHNSQYYFRIESGALKYTYTLKASTINVIESPPKRTVKLYVEQKEVQDQEEVLEGSSVSLRCSAETLCSSPPPTLTWSSTPRIPLNESSRQQELISDLNFTAAHRHHRVTFTCTITYQILDKNKTAQDSITLHVQYAPKISPSSSCNRTDVIVCFCEFDGNPSPELEWHLSGRPVTNSSDTFISEERLSSTVLRSSITLHQSLTHTSLQCVSNNTHGTERKLFQLLPPVSRSNHSSVMIGVAVAAVLVIMFCVITWICVRKKSMKLQQTRREDATRSISTSDAIPCENEEESVYANNVMMSSAGTATENPESLIYSSIDFKNVTSESQEFGNISSLHAEYAVVKHCSGGVSKAESSTGESSRAIEAPVIVSADGVTKQTESKASEEELVTDSSQLYARVNRRNP
ncbi:sialic acid-binding Ig-like lectin 7 [Megalobrama amblycephala]|uniref:sialic acid-binding Ig-like lectin 7 n=1 Tax=Megalobrama amblycephala TaxID=75352 RepID=UPI002013C4BD|nr:sialic acid-binding Ig-like lectin 7 [Megalobrama amblycephala]